MEDCKDIQNINTEQAAKIALLSIEDMVIEMSGMQLQLQAFGLPNTERETAEQLGGECLRETSYNTGHEEEHAQLKFSKLTKSNFHTFQ
ncbi:hypothetical protein ElyMa_003512600 [Elysia marginata]|uniref:Uncharacterized protein n=1 Tax=Elysia marginata TaxID=1093978 RepID=A0AAV4EH35_9GAST|nr:hypothetical protein ElyMa_003512600 [Elysia marginata]